MIMPGIAFGALLLAPFLDSGPERRPYRRPVAVGMMILAVGAAIYLTWGLLLLAIGKQLREQGEIKKEAEIDTLSRRV